MTNADSYVDPFKQGEPFNGHTVSKVLKSRIVILMKVI